MQPRRLFALALVTGLLHASTAVAQTEEDPEPEVSTAGPYSRMLAVAVNGGLDTPLGVIGAEIEFAPIEWLNIYAGGGVSRSGARVGGGVSFRAPLHSSAFGFQLGLAGGPMDWDSHAEGAENLTQHRYWEFALFAHAGMTYEYRWDEGIFGRIGIGAEALIAGDVTACAGPGTAACSPEDTAGLAVPFRAWASLTVGYAFEL